MQVVGIQEVSGLLGVSCQRIRQLIYQNRVKGAYKTKLGWKIPLYREMPQIIPGTRGPKGRWQLQRRPKTTIIHVNKHKIARNRQKDDKDPVIIVRQGSKVSYGNRVSFEGKCQIIYEPDNQKKYGGAKVWIAVGGEIPIYIE